MSNYHYIITGLPKLVLDLDEHGFSYKAIASEIREQLSLADNKLIDWLESGFNPDYLSHHLYKAVKKLPSQFLKDYYELDRNIRNAQVLELSKKNNVDPAKYLVGEANTEFEGFAALQDIFKEKDMYEKEHRLDTFRWDCISEIVTLHYFDIDVILAFLAKAKIVERWQSLDKEKGAILFRQYVDEVRGTYRGIDNKDNN